MADFPKTIKEHRNNVMTLPCLVTWSDHNKTLHHCHGGSIKERGWHSGTGQKVSEALIMPLHHDLHVGKNGIDYGVGVKTWEAKYGRQARYIDMLSEFLGYDLWELAERWKSERAI